MMDSFVIDEPLRGSTALAMNDLAAGHRQNTRFTAGRRDEPG